MFAVKQKQRGIILIMIKLFGLISNPSKLLWIRVLNFTVVCFDGKFKIISFAPVKLM